MDTNVRFVNARENQGEKDLVTSFLLNKKFSQT